MHPDNPLGGSYDYEALCATHPPLREKILARNGHQSLDYEDPAAIKVLNQALIFHYCELEFWDFPGEFLCPGLPGRADYLYHVKSLLPKEANDPPTVLDIGTGANLVYPILGVCLLGWRFIATESNPTAFKSAAKILNANARLKDRIDLRFQPDGSKVFEGVTKASEQIDASVCNPPFYNSEVDAERASMQKRTKNAQYWVSKATQIRTFEGVNNELVFPGGEVGFIGRMIRESVQNVRHIHRVSSLVSKKSTLMHLEPVFEELALEFETMPMHHGNKARRMIAWRPSNGEY